MQIDESFEVAAPREDVFRVLTTFELFPEFMTGVESVFAETRERLRWRVSIAGVPETFYAVITELVPDERIAWTSVDATTMAWSVQLAELDPGTTCVTVHVKWSPPGHETAADVPELDELSVRCDFHRFRMLAQGLHAAAA
ncbi:putative membrane protein [Agrococcus sp. UYP10]|uniref:SRPBCC family protein n=1 Tax=Agrococcus sp. UYP10 TaxID=1756355 RepID=UPI0033936CDD